MKSDAEKKVFLFDAKKIENILEEYKESIV